MTVARDATLTRPLDLPRKRLRSAFARQGKRILAAAVLVAGIALLFDIVTESTVTSDVLRHMAAKMFVPYDSFFYSRQAGAADRDRIVVVDLGKSTLQRYRAVWPISYGQHARILEAIRRAKPKALFVDFQFQAIREDASLGDLQNSLCAFSADGIPVFLAAGSAPDESSLRPELEMLRDAQGRPCFQKVAVGYEADAADRTVWTYPLKGGHGERSTMSAALAMASATLKQPVDVSGEHTHMGLTWGSGDASQGPHWQSNVKVVTQRSEGEHREAAKLSSEPTPGQHYCRVPSARDIVPLYGVGARLFGEEPDTRPACPMHKTIEAGWLTTPKTVMQDEELGLQLRDRAVFYGGSFEANEFVNSPLHGEIPGVYLHAQAADNLLRFGDRWRHPDLAGPLNPYWERPMAFVALFVVALTLISGQEVVQGLRRRLFARWKYPKENDTRARKTDDSRFVKLLTYGVSEILVLLGRLGQFYVMLLVAVPLSLLLEKGFRVSVIGYSSILVFCLLGEVFVRSKEAIALVDQHPALAPPAKEP